jgi:hypothetical protein
VNRFSDNRTGLVQILERDCAHLLSVRMVEENFVLRTQKDTPGGGLSVELWATFIVPPS